MIIRILGEGQFDVPDEAVTTLNELDATVEASIEAGDEAAFRRALDGLLAGVRQAAAPHEEGSLDSSDLILPHRRRHARRGPRPAQRRRLDPRLIRSVADSRFIKDTGLTVRMTTVMFLLGALFVALVVAVMFAGPERQRFLGAVHRLAGIGVAFYQWWNSDRTAMKAMRAREVTPEEAPELHGMIDRLCALADMPKPRVGVAQLDLPNAFATGRSPRAVGRLRDDRDPGSADARGARGGARPRAVPRRAPRRAGDDRGVLGGDRGRHVEQGCTFGALSGRGTADSALFFSHAASSAWSCTP